MFRFGDPEYLYLLLTVPFVALILWHGSVQRRRSLEKFGDPVLVRKLIRTVSLPRRRLKAAALIFAWTALVLALARPQFGTRVETVKREGQDVFVALDVSLSMVAEDIRPSRLEKAKRELSGLIDRLEGDRIGLIAFAGDAFVQCPLTLDYGAAKLFLSAMGPDLIPTPGTVLAQAVRKAMDSFVGAETKSKVLVLLTDGEDHDGSFREAAHEAAEAGIVIHTIGIGTARGVPIPVSDDSGRHEGFKKDRQGEVVLTRLDEAALREVAEATGGRYFRVSESGDELDALYSAIAGMEKTELAAREVTLFDEKFQLMAGLALFCLTLESLISESRRTSREWRGRFQ